jgi:hypothetical protein
MVSAGDKRACATPVACSPARACATRVLPERSTSDPEKAYAEAFSRSAWWCAMSAPTISSRSPSRNDWS